MTKKLQTTLPDPLAARVEALAELTGMQTSTLVFRAVQEWMEENYERLAEFYSDGSTEPY